MVKAKLIKIINIKTKIIQGKFGNGKYFGYGDNKIISLVKFKTNTGTTGFGESLVGIYSPELFRRNVNYLSRFFLNKNIDNALKEIDRIQKNKFFYYQGLLKSVISSFEIALLSIKSKIDGCSLGESINKVYFKNNNKKNNLINIYSSAGSIKCTLKDLEKDIKKSKDLGINTIKIRLNINIDYRKKIKMVEAKMKNFAIDLIANSFEKNDNKKKLLKFLDYIKNKKILWIEEPLNVDNLNSFENLMKYNKINFSYGENFNSFIDFSNLLNIKNLKYLNVDITHCTISDLKRLIDFIETRKINKKIILHCWGSLINLNTSLEVASILKKYIYKVEFPITDFSLNDFFVNNSKIKDSKIYLENRLNEIEIFYDKKLNIITDEKNKFKFD